MAQQAFGPPWAKGFGRRGLIGGAGLLLVCLLAGLLSRWTISDPTLRDRALADLSRASGLVVTASGPATLRLLPRPTVELREVTLRGADGAIAVEADGLRGRLAPLALLRGRLVIVGATVDSPTAVFDMDRLRPLVAGLLGSGARGSAFAMLHTGGLTVNDGVVRLASVDAHRDTTLSDVSATVTWPSDDEAASLAGVATWRGVAGAFHLDVDRPARLIGGNETLASARLKSAALDLDIEGTLSGAGEGRLTGQVAASTPDLPSLLRRIGLPTPQLAGLHQARLAATAAVTRDTLAFDQATITLDDMAFDGALVVRQHEEGLALAGTLATDRMVLDPFLRAFPPLLTHGGRWSLATLDTRAIANDEIDLRISATAARWGKVLLEDGSLSLQSGRGRMELSLGEARAYDGLLKGRIVATLDGAATDVRAEATVSRLDLKSLLKDLPGAYRATGTVTGHVAVEGRGATPAALIGSLAGEAQCNVHDGEIGGRLLASVFHDAPVASLLALPMATRGGAPFDAASFDATIENGVLSLADSWVSWPAERGRIAGTVSLPAQRLDLSARIGGEEGTSEAAYALSGPWRALRLRPQP